MVQVTSTALMASATETVNVGTAGDLKAHAGGDIKVTSLGDMSSNVVGHMEASLGSVSVMA
eukprot:COSAG01_NODE_60388_length_295_cov_0.704082_2_plen_60_part_01